MKIMVTLDGSQFAEAVVDPVVQLAREARAEVYLVQVVDPSDLHNTMSGSDELNETIEGEFGAEAASAEAPQVVEYLDQALERVNTEVRDYLRRVGLRFDAVHPEAVVLVSEDVDEELIKFARARRVDLIAMASHGRSGLAELILGSHAHRIMESGVAPVLLVRPRDIRRR